MGRGSRIWALGEILKAHTGILESDPPATAQAKLDAVLPEGSEREWFRQRLLPLLGIEATSTARTRGAVHRVAPVLRTHRRAGSDRVGVRGPALGRPGHAGVPGASGRPRRGVPLLIVGTARPELFDHHPDYAKGCGTSRRSTWSPLTETETTRLVCGLLETSVIPAELQTPILERAGGNPCTPRSSSGS